MRLSRLVLVAVTLGLLVPAGAMAKASGSAKVPVASFKTGQFGRVLARSDFQALYYWEVEKKAGGKFRCLGDCLESWPPLIVKSRAAVPRRVAGIKGRFGVARRPDGRLQVTWNGLPVYTYAHEKPRQVLCDNVGGWFVVRV